jgi:hypothetical protein
VPSGELVGPAQHQICERCYSDQAGNEFRDSPTLVDDEWLLSPGSEDNHSARSVGEASSESVPSFRHCWEEVVARAKSRVDAMIRSIDNVAADVDPYYPILGPPFPISCAQLQSEYSPPVNHQSLPQTISPSLLINNPFTNGQTQHSLGIASPRLEPGSRSGLPTPEPSLEDGPEGSEFNDQVEPLEPSATDTDPPPLVDHGALVTVLCDFPGCGKGFPGHQKLKYEILSAFQVYTGNHANF